MHDKVRARQRCWARWGARRGRSEKEKVEEGRGGIFHADTFRRLLTLKVWGEGGQEDLQKKLHDVLREK